MFHTFYAANNKGADQTVQMRCSFMEVVQFKGVILKVKSLYAQKFSRAPVRKRYSVKPTLQHCKLFVIHKDAMVRITACGKMENFRITRQWKTTKKRWKNTKRRWKTQRYVENTKGMWKTQREGGREGGKHKGKAENTKGMWKTQGEGGKHKEKMENTKEYGKHKGSVENAKGMWKTQRECEKLKENVENSKGKWQGRWETQGEGENHKGNVENLPC